MEDQHRSLLPPARSRSDCLFELTAPGTRVNEVDTSDTVSVAVTMDLEKTVSIGVGTQAAMGEDLRKGKRRRRERAGVE